MKYRIDNRGFTLTELMVVVVIAGVMATIAIPSYISYLPHLRLNAATRDLISDLRLARQLAVSKNTPYTVDFVSSKRYQITGGTTVKTVDLVNVDIDDDPLPSDFQFTPFGTITAQITVPLTNNRGETRTLEILTTGTVRLQ